MNILKNILAFFSSIEIIVIMILVGGSFLGGVYYGKDLAKEMKLQQANKIVFESAKPPAPPPQLHLHYYQNLPDSNKKKNNKLQAYSDADKYCMAQNIYFEAGNQSPLGKLAVGLVVMTRLADSRFPDTICGVIKQKNQFSWVNNGKSNEPEKNWVWDESVRIAGDVLKSDPDFLQFVSRYLGSWTGMTNYHADYVDPAWSNSMERVVTVDEHIFYRQ
jgi:spore germination cell wall hydrolase CwlJ-like protein